MGQAILYCFRCSTQLREAQFEQGKAYRIDSWVCCAACAPDALKSLPPDRVQLLLKQISGREKKPHPAATGAPRRESTPRIPQAPPTAEPAGSSKWMIAGGAALLVLAVVLAVALSGKPTPPPEPAATAPKSSTPRTTAPMTGPPPPSLPPAIVADTPERQALLKARKYAQDHPEDLEGQLREFSDLSLLADKTDVGAEARRTVDSLNTRQRQTIDRGMAAVEAEIADPLNRGDYGLVLKLLEAASSRLAGAQWKIALEKRERSVREDIFKAFEGVKEQYREARTRGRGAEAETLVARVRSWGLAKLSEDLSKLAVEAPAVPPPNEPSRSAEGRVYDGLREKALTRAAGRDFAGAAADLERAGAGLKEEAVKKEFADDLRDLRELERACAAAIAGLASSRTLAFRTVDGQSISGRVVTIDADRVEILVDPLKPTVFAEWSNIRMFSFLKAQNPDERLLVLFERIDGLDRPKPSAEEVQARELYYEAERQFRVMSTRDKAIDAYKQLKQKFKDTALVRGAAARIDRRSEAGKEYYFLPSDLGFGGTFSMTKEGKLESIAESDPSQANRNFVEWEYLPLPSATYRCWALLGGCCADVFACHYQATGHAEISPKTKKRAPAEPGGDLASPLKPSIRNLKPHGKEPHKPTRWEWVEVPVAKTTTPGVRKTRLITDQLGFAVGGVVVSSSRTRPPTDAEVAELAKARALDAPPAWVVARPGSAPRILLDHFPQDIQGWGFHPGTEFPGAKGSQSHDGAVGRDGKGSLKVVADFSGGGAYVSTGRNLPPGCNPREVRFWIKSDTLVAMGVRIGDSSDQCHQSPLALKGTKDWQEVVLNFEKLVGREHWGGANDGKLHGPVKSFYLTFGRNVFGGATGGEVWIDDVEAVLDAEVPSDR